MNETTGQIVYPGSENYSSQDIAAPGTRPMDLGPEPLVKADDTAYILFEVPDLDLQQRFLEDFGLVLAARTADEVFLRGHGASPYCYVARKGPQARFLGAGFQVKTRDELETLAQASGFPIENIDAPGGGQRVRLRDPDDFIVDVVHGRESVDPLPTRRDLFSVNTPEHKLRVNRGQRPPLQAAAIDRFGHYVLSVSHFDTSWRWYRKHLGLVPSDVLCTDDGSPVLSFTRLDRGEKPADHHTVVLAQGLEPAYMHSAYETLDMDSIGQGQQFLKMKGWQHFWGIGRHILGSQVFDYWLDPYGFEVEHYADGDVFDNTYPTHYHLLDRGGLWAWGNDVPDSMRPKNTVAQLRKMLKALLRKRIDRGFPGRMKRAMSVPPRPWLK